MSKAAAEPRGCDRPRADAGRGKNQAIIMQGAAMEDFGRPDRGLHVCQKAPAPHALYATTVRLKCTRARGQLSMPSLRFTLTPPRLHPPFSTPHVGDGEVTAKRAEEKLLQNAHE